MVNFLKTKSFKSVNTRVTTTYCSWYGVKDRDWGKEKVVKKDGKGMLILEKYKNAHCGNSHGVLQEMPVK